MSRRIVFDTSTLVSAALRLRSIPHQALLATLATSDLCASAGALAELELVLGREKFDRYLDRTSRQEFVSLIRRHVHLFELLDSNLQKLKPPCRDPKDHQFLALALVAGADILVSSDEDLLQMNPWHGILILRPGDLLSRFANNV